MKIAMRVCRGGYHPPAFFLHAASESVGEGLAPPGSTHPEMEPAPAKPHQSLPLEGKVARRQPAVTDEVFHDKTGSAFSADPVVLFVVFLPVLRAGGAVPGAPGAPAAALPCLPHAPHREHDDDDERRDQNDVPAVHAVTPFRAECRPRARSAPRPTRPRTARAPRPRPSRVRARAAPRRLPPRTGCTAG